MIRLLAIALLLVACAPTPTPTTLPMRPATADPFLGDWIGTWVSNRGPKGDMEATITRDLVDPNLYKLTAVGSSQPIPPFAGDGVFKDGEMVFTTKLNLVIKLRLVQEDKIVADYLNPTINDSGIWSLKRKK
jgi:hypothetical protein